jgi:hypothetical protein
METSLTDISNRKQQEWKTADSQIQKQVKESLNEVRTEVIERPFLYLGIAFAAGLVSQSFPVRLVFSVLVRLISFLSRPAILILGILKIRELFSAGGESGAS